MNTHFRSNILITATLALSLITAACAPTVKPTVKAPASTVTAPIVATKAAKPTEAPPKPTVAPTKKAEPTAVPKPTLAPTKVTPTALELGQSQQIGDLKITPNKENATPAVGTDKAKTGNVFLTFEVTVENTSKTASISFDPLKLMITGPGGVDTYPLVIIKTAKDELSSQTLKPGASASGVLIFEVPEKHTGFELMFENESNHVSWIVGA